MSEKAEVEVEVEEVETEEPPKKEHPPVKQKSGGTGTFLALLLALGALGASYYLWMQQQAASATTSALQGKIDQLAASIDQRHQELVARLSIVPEHQHPQLQQRLGQTESMVFDLRSRLGQERRGWLISEVEYLLRIADHRLNLERDSHTAVAALQSAIVRLQALNDPSFAVVIEQLHADIAKINAVQQPDIAMLANQLADLGASVENLPLSTAVVQTGTVITPDEANADASIWQKMWHDLIGLVSIRRQDEADSPMLVPEQRYFLKQNLKLKLASARLALLSGNAAAWKTTLLEATGWMQRYFDTDTETVRGAIATLQRLTDVDLHPALPQLGDTRRLLQQAAMQQPLAPAPAAPTTAQPVKPAAAPKPAAKAEEPEAKADEAPAPQPTTDDTPTVTPAPDETQAGEGAAQ